MKSKRLIKKCLSLLLSLVLVLSLLPMTAFADSQPQPWATDAVNALNDIYGDDIFTADNTSVTVGDMVYLLTDTFRYPADGEIITDYLNPSGDLTRLKLAQVVYSLYGLAENLSAGEFSDCDDSAVITLRSLGIVNGKSDGTFAPNDIVTNAELAVIFYRTLGKIGAGGDNALENLKPGEYGYDELMYLYTRGCVPKDIDLSQNIEEDILNAWYDRLAVLPPESGRTVTWAVYEAVYSDTLIDAIVLIVDEDKASLVSDGMGDRIGIFSDVDPGDWFYDGVMYLFNNGIVNGYGDGNFGPYNQLMRAEMAVLMCRINNKDTNSPAAGVVLSDVDEQNWAYNAVTHAIKEGYMTYANGTYFNPSGQATRQEAALAIFKSYGEYDAEDVNLSVLERFDDGADIGEAYKTAMAYLVSVGVLRGGADGLIMPEAEIDRASFGVLLARVMMGLDTSKMHDYETAVTEVLQ